MKLSIVIGTLNRFKYLQKCIDSVRQSCAGIESEVIVVDGGSIDGTQQWAHGQRIIFIEQGAAYGAVWAFNAGFYAAEGEYVAALNDDCTVVGDTLRLACDYLDSHATCGQVAIPWKDVGDISEPTVQHVTLGKQAMDVIYANFGVARRWLGDEVGWWGEPPYLVHYGGDCELSFQIIMRGYTVDELVGGQIAHLRVRDSTRRVCYNNQAFNQKWRMVDVKQFMSI